MRKIVIHSSSNGALNRGHVLEAIVDQAIVSATSFVTGVIVGRNCPKEQFGFYMLGFTIILLASGVQHALVTSPYTILSIHLSEQRHAQYTGSTLIHQIGIAVIVILILLGGGIITSFRSGPRNVSYMLFMLSAIIEFILIRDYVRYVCFAWLNYANAIFIDSAVAGLQICSLLLLAHHGLLSSNLAFMVIGISSGLASLSWIIIMRKRIAFKLDSAFIDLKKSWALGKWMFAGSLMLLLGSQLYPWMITMFHGANKTGVFAACWGIAAVTNPFFLGIQNYLAPFMVHTFKKNKGEIRSTVYKTILLLAIFGGLFFLVLMIIGNQLIQLLYGDKYAGNTNILNILALGVLAFAIDLAPANGILAMQKPDINAKINFFQILSTLTFGIWLVKLYGPLGAALGILMGNLVVALIRLIMFSRLTSIFLIKEIADA